MSFDTDIDEMPGRPAEYISVSEFLSQSVDTLGTLRKNGMLNKLVAELEWRVFNAFGPDAAENARARIEGFCEQQQPTLRDGALLLPIFDTLTTQEKVVLSYLVRYLASDPQTHIARHQPEQLLQNDAVDLIFHLIPSEELRRSHELTEANLSTLRITTNADAARVYTKKYAPYPRSHNPDDQPPEYTHFEIDGERVSVAELKQALHKAKNKAPAVDGVTANTFLAKGTLLTPC